MSSCWYKTKHVADWSPLYDVFSARFEFLNKEESRQFTDKTVNRHTFNRSDSTVHSSPWAYRRAACLYKPDQFAHSSIVHSSKHWRINNYRRIGVKTFSWADVHVYVKALWCIGATSGVWAYLCVWVNA